MQKGITKMKKNGKNGKFFVKCATCKKILVAEKEREAYKDSWVTFIRGEAHDKGWRALCNRTNPNQISFNDSQTEWSNYCPSCSIELNILDYYNEYLKSDYWLNLRRIRFEIDGWKCTKCGSAMCLEAHHTNYENLGDAERELKDLVTLCHNCHEEVHGNDLRIKGAG